MILSSSATKHQSKAVLLCQQHAAHVYQGGRGRNPEIFKHKMADKGEEELSVANGSTAPAEKKQGNLPW